MIASAGRARFGIVLSMFAALALSASACTSTTLEDQVSSGLTTVAADDTSGDDGADLDPDIEARPSSRDDEAVGSLGTEPEVTLIDAGAEPRRPLRFDLTAGDTRSVEMSMQMTLQASGTGPGAPQTPIDQVMPTLIMPMTMTVTSVDDRGSAELEATYGAITLGSNGTIDPATRALLVDQYTDLSDLSISITQSNRGHVIYAETSELEGALGAVGVDLSSQMANLSAPFPAEAVGVGASWTVSTEIEMTPLSLLQTSTYTITAIDGDVVTMALTVEQELAPGTNDLGPGGIIEQYSMTSVGEIIMDLTQAAPLSSTSEGTQLMTIAAPSGSTGSIDQRMHMVMSVRPT